MELIARLTSLVAPPFCWGCGGEAPAGPLCGACRAYLRPLGSEPVVVAGLPVWAPVAYEGPARALVSGLKFRGATGLAEPLAARIAACAPAAMFAPPVALVPVPLHPARRRRRGFNQAERIARALAARTGLRCEPCLERRGPATRQVGRGRAERLGSGPRFAVRAPRVGGLAAVIVDDVITTGGTVAACAAALRSAGVDVRGAVAFARTPGR